MSKLLNMHACHAIETMESGKSLDKFRKSLKILEFVVCGLRNCHFCGLNCYCSLKLTVLRSFTLPHHFQQGITGSKKPITLVKVVSLSLKNDHLGQDKDLNVKYFEIGRTMMFGVCSYCRIGVRVCFLF